MKLKKPVFSYLDMLFSNLRRMDGFPNPQYESIIKYIDQNDKTILSIAVISKKRNRFENAPNMHLHFSHSQFYFISNMFTISPLEVIPLIKEYISTILFPGLDLSLVPFHPYLK